MNDKPLGDGSHYKASLPKTVVIEISNICNLRCKMCFIWGPTARVRRKTGFMDIDLYKKIVDEASQYGQMEIAIQSSGEPLLHPHFFEMVRYAKESGASTYTISNGSLLDIDNVEKILACGLDRIAISIDGTNKETYERIRTGSNFENVISNLNSLIEIKKHRRVTRPWIKVFMVRLPENETEVDTLIEKWLPVVDEVAILEHRRADHLGQKVFNECEFQLKRVPCQRIWDMAVISWEGKVVLCCEDVAAEVIMGDIKTDSLQDIWFGTTFEKMRQIHILGNYNEIRICPECDAWTEYYTNVKFKGNIRIEDNPRMQRYLRSSARSSLIDKSKSLLKRVVFK